MEAVIIIGIDLAKRSFQVHGACADGSVAFRKGYSACIFDADRRNRGKSPGDFAF